MQLVSRLPNKKTYHLISRYTLQQNLFINIRNNFDEKEKSTRKSRQKDGWGLRNIDALVQEYQGNIKHFIKDGQYQIEILLPIKIGTIPTKEF
ncbi:MAG: GHKL domain-containing protein [Streptococcus thermophilus]